MKHPSIRNRTSLLAAHKLHNSHFTQYFIWGVKPKETCHMNKRTLFSTLYTCIGQNRPLGRA